MRGKINIWTYECDGPNCPADGFLEVGYGDQITPGRTRIVKSQKTADERAEAEGWLLRRNGTTFCRDCRRELFP